MSIRQNFHINFRISLFQQKKKAFVIGIFIWDWINKISLRIVNILKRWQEFTEELYKKALNDSDNYDDVVTHLEPHIFECEISSVQFSSVAQSCPTLCDPMNRSTPGLPIHHHLPEFTQTHVHWVRDAIQTSHPLSSPFPPSLNPSQHQSLFQWVSSLHEVAKVLEFQL